MKGVRTNKTIGLQGNSLFKKRFVLRKKQLQTEKENDYKQGAHRYKNKKSPVITGLFLNLFLSGKLKGLFDLIYMIEFFPGKQFDFPGNCWKIL